MGAPYTSVTVANYNLNPPPDDGTQVESNRVKWATGKTKLTDPLKTALESVNANITAAFAKVIGGNGVTSTAISYTVLSGDHGKLVRATVAGVTITTPDATSVTSPFVFAFRNASDGSVTLDGNGSQTIDGSANIAIAPNQGAVIFTDGTNWHTAGRSAEFAAGTVMLFNQTAAPSGWTKNTSTGNDSALRLVTGTVGTGGTSPFTTAFASRTPAGSISGEIARDGHGAQASGGSDSIANTSGGSALRMLSSTLPLISGVFTGTAMNFAVNYVDIIRATKD